MCYLSRLQAIGWLWVFLSLSRPLPGQSLPPIFTVTPDSIDRLIPISELEAALLPHDAPWETVRAADYQPLPTLPTKKWYPREATDVCVRFGLHNPTADTVRLFYWIANSDRLIQYSIALGDTAVAKAIKKEQHNRRKYNKEEHRVFVTIPPKTTIIYHTLYPYYRYEREDLFAHFESVTKVRKWFFEYREECQPMVYSSIALLSVLLFASIFFGFHYFYMRSTAQGWYIGYIASMMLFFSYHLERAFPFPILFSHVPVLLGISEGIFVSLSSFFYIGFLRVFFELPQRAPHHDRWVRWTMYTFIGAFLWLVGAELFCHWENYAGVFFQLWEPLLPLLQIACIPLLLYGQRTFAEKMVLVGVGALFAGTAITILIPFEIRGDWWGQNHLICIKIGVFVEIVFFSLGLALKSRDELLESQRVRERIARDLHDDIGSTLGSISILSETLPSQEVPSPAHTRLHLIGERTREVIASMEDIVWSVNPSHDGLSHAVDRLRNYSVEVLEAQQTRVHMDICPTLLERTLPVEQRREFLLIAKEALHNVAKYAQAKDVWLTLRQEGHALRLSVRDNGVGFDLEKAKGGNGLRNMRARAEKLSGTLVFNTRVGQGTRIELVFPLP